MFLDETVGCCVSSQTSRTRVADLRCLRVLFFLTLTAIAQATEESLIDLRPNTLSSSIRQVHVVVELSGNLKVSSDTKQPKKLPIQGKGEFRFDEKRLPNSEGRPQLDVRYYRNAEAQFRIADGDVLSQLHADRRLIAIETGTNNTTIFSPQGPLTRYELELIDTQGASVLLDKLLPPKPVAVGASWNHADELVSMLLKLDVVSENNVQSKLVRIEGTVAHLEASGSVSGSIGGMATDLEVLAKYSFDTQQRQVSWLAMSIKEDRAIGHAEPGLEITARIRVAIQSIDSCPELADEVVAKLPLRANDGMTQLNFKSNVGGFQFLHSRNWKAMVDRHDVCVLRFVDRGEMIAQCNLSRLADVSTDKLLSMESFQVEIQKSLEKSFSEFVEAKSFRTERGLRCLKVIVAGITSELPIQWIYYHFTDDKGRQASMVFTMDGKFIERFRAEDQSLIATLELADRTAGLTSTTKSAEQKPQPSTSATKSR